MKKILLFMLLIVLSLPALASSWVQVDIKTWIDTSSIKYNGNTRTYWSKMLNPGDWELINNKKVWYIMRQNQIDCVSKNSKGLYYIDYGLKGETLDSFSGSHLWRPIPPGTILEAEYEYVCGNY